MTGFDAEDFETEDSPEEETQYVLLAERFRKVKKFFREDHTVGHDATRYFKGDILTLSEDDAKRLLEAGAVKVYDPNEVEESEPEPEETAEPDTESPTENVEPVGADTEPTEPVEGQGDGTGEAGDGTEPEPGTEPDGDEETENDEDVKSEPIEDYSEYGYPDLQQEAKGRGLNAGGGADDIRARLMEDDAVKAAAESDNQ